MKRIILLISLFGIYFLNSVNTYAEDRLELETTFIKGNKELPQILYVVPWKDIKRSKKKEQQIVLYSLFGNLFEPINPNELNHEILTEKSAN